MTIAKETERPRSRFVSIAPDLSPERLPLRQVNDVLSAVQDLASGRDPFESSHVASRQRHQSDAGAVWFRGICLRLSRTRRSACETFCA